MKHGLSRHRVNPQQIIYQVLRAALFVWQILSLSSVAGFSAGLAGWIVGCLGFSFRNTPISSLLFLIFNSHLFFSPEKGTISSDRQAVLLWQCSLLDPTFPTGAAVPFSRTFLTPLAGLLSRCHENFKASPSAEEVAELPLALCTQEWRHCQQTHSRGAFEWMHLNVTLFSRHSFEPGKAGR